MTTMKERMEARKLAKAVGTAPVSTTSKTVNILLTSPDTPVRPSEEFKQSDNTVKHIAVESVPAPQSTTCTSNVKANSALKSGAGGLLAAAVARRKGGIPKPTNGSIAAKARAAMEGRNVKETTEEDDGIGHGIPTSGTADNSSDMGNTDSGASTSEPVSAASLVKQHRKAEFSDTQVEEVRKIVDLDADELLDDLVMLEEYVVGDCPEIGGFMQRMHTNLRQYPELTHILNEAQIGIVVQSFMKRKNIEITAPTNGSKAKQSVGNMTRGKSKQEVLDIL